MPVRAHQLITALATLVVLGTLLVAPAFAQGNPVDVLLRPTPLSGFARSGASRPAFDVARGDWAESAGFTVPDEQDVVVHTLVTYVATLPHTRNTVISSSLERDQSEFHNEMTHAEYTKSEKIRADAVASSASSTSMSRSVPLSGIRPTYATWSDCGSRRGRWKSGHRRRGTDRRRRRSILLSVTQLLMSRIAQAPIPPMNEAGRQTPVSLALHAPH